MKASKPTTLLPFIQALLAAVLFGASAPIAKSLLVGVGPVTLAALLYLSSGLSLWLLKARGRIHEEAGLARSDWPWLAGAILAGGVAAPIILMLSLRSTPASTASLLLNFETIATTLIAALVFREALGREALGAVALITAASILLSTRVGGQWGLSAGAFGVMAACLLWGIDNNLTRQISEKDPVEIGRFKGLVAGAISFLLSRVAGEPLPSAALALGAMAVGALSYGLSIVLFVYALRGLGAARTSALFSTAPLAGIVLALALLGDRPGSNFWIAIPLMGIGTWLLLREEHAHLHEHPVLEHDHSHNHADGHHHEPHHAGRTRAVYHSHRHRHSPVQHSHKHTPDIHHRHVHKT